MKGVARWWAQVLVCGTEFQSLLPITVLLRGGPFLVVVWNINQR